MKRSFLLICSATLFFASCKEVPPDINFGGATATDTTYVLSTVPTTNAHNVLVEEFTGQSCSNCPAGHAILAAESATYPGQVNVIALFQDDGAPQTTPPTGATYDFRSSVALTIGTSAIYNSASQIPCAGIDRVPYSSSSGNLIADGNWDGAIQNRIPQIDSLNMTVSSSFVSSTGVATVSGVATITVTATYTQTVSTQQNLSIAIVTDSITDLQDSTFGYILSNYLFNDVFVGMITSVPYGDPLIDTIATKVPGRFVQLIYTYSLPNSFIKGAINPAHCRVIAFVNSPGIGGNYQVYQSVQTPLVGP